MHTMNPELSHSSYSLFKYIALGRLSLALARPFAPLIPLSCICTAVTKSGTGTWDLGREDSGTPGRGTRGHGDLGLGDAGTWDSGTWDSVTRGRGDVGLGDAGLGTRGRGTRGRDKQKTPE